MSLFDFFFPEQAAASHLRRMADRQARNDRLNRTIDVGMSSNLEGRIEELERDVGILSLVLASVKEVANENGAVSREEIKQQIDDLDVLDGFKDGKLDAKFLRKWTS